MSFKVELLPNEPIMVTSFYAAFDVRRDAAEVVRQMRAILDAAPEPIYMVDDTIQMKLSFSDLVGGLAMVTRGDTDVVHHPKVRRIVIITTSDVLKFGTTALKQKQYGASDIAVYSSMDDALSAIRMELSHQKA